MANYYCCVPESAQCTEVPQYVCQMEEETRCTYPKDYKDEYCPPPRGLNNCRSRELTSSILRTRCECVKRNGLQDDCPRTECKGRPCCLTKPVPSCCPAKYEYRHEKRALEKKKFEKKANQCNKVPTSSGPCKQYKKGQPVIQKVLKTTCQRIRNPQVQIVCCQPDYGCPQTYDAYCPENENW